LNVGNLLEISLFMAIIVVGALNYLDLARLSKLLFFKKKNKICIYYQILISLLNYTFLLLFGFEQFSFLENVFYEFRLILLEN
jgi:hypothetical protein